MLKLRLRPISATEYILDLGEYQIWFETENDVFAGFMQLGKSVPLTPLLLRLEQACLQLVKNTATIKREPWLCPAKIAFERYFDVAFLVEWAKLLPCPNESPNRTPPRRL